MIAPPGASSRQHIRDESARVAALRRYRILDTDPEQAFDDLTLLASQICGTPMAALSLIDNDRQWFKSRVGLTAAETARNVSFCTHAIDDPDQMMVVPNALEDGRFKNNPLVWTIRASAFMPGLRCSPRTGTHSARSACSIACRAR